MYWNAFCMLAYSGTGLSEKSPCTERKTSLCRRFEVIMALGTHLTIRDYLDNRKVAELMDQKWNLTKRTNLFRKEGFEGVLSSCLKDKKDTGLTASDYLQNPVYARSETQSTGLETFRKGPASPIEPQTHEKKESEGQKKISVREDIERSIQEAAKTYDLPPELIRGVIQAESDFQVEAVSSAGARGLMQLMPATAKDLGVEDPFNIDQNIDGGSRYLKNMLVRFGSDLKMALSAYNAGPGTVERYGGDVPYSETRQYVARVLEFSGLTA